jgi:pectate lyase
VRPRLCLEVWYSGCLSQKPLCSADDGFVVAIDNDFVDGENAAEPGTLTSVPYDYTLLGIPSVKVAVVGTAGNTLSFDQGSS